MDHRADWIIAAVVWPGVPDGGERVTLFGAAMSDSKNSARDQNRHNFPFAVNVIADLREELGDGVKLSYAAQNGYEVGIRWEVRMEQMPSKWVFG